ncbi:MAG TPA: hypothetical protein VGZ47_04250 [Gemmataceae bacterium]|jgi:hypothetical protein|nr:hypothetical protein [Gemmataceae bacterium]
MEKKDVITKLIEIHKQYQKDGGFDDADRVTKDTRPLADLKDFESDFIPEIVRRVARELNCPFPKGTRVKNVYVEKGRKLTIAEIAGKIVGKYAPKECKV